jgi:ATP-dependent helicase/nuclease subunit A
MLRGSALDVTSSCFVFASAGSGKTSTLVDRYVKSVFCGLHPSEILCLTFTNAAVLEMSTRMSRILESLYLNESNFVETYLRDHLDLGTISESDITNAASMFFKFQDNLSNIRIVTIHSLCQELLQQFPLEAGISPNYEIIDECDAAIILQQAKRNAIQKLLHRDDLWHGLSSSMSTYSFEELVEKVYQLSSNFREFFSGYQYQDADAYRAVLNSIFRPKPHLEFSEEQMAFLNEEGLGNQPDLTSHFLTAAGTIRMRLPFKNKTMASSVAHTIFENSQNLKKRNFIERSCGFIDAAKIILDEYQNLKAAQNVLDFSDVLYKTKYLMTQSCAKEFVLSNVCSGIKSIMVDEAQDLSTVQWELVSLFASDVFADAGSRSSIMVVGDTKQSIYRFQGAHYKMLSDFYDGCKDSLSKLGKPCKTDYLNMNYRTVPEILAVVDRVFEHINAKFDLDLGSIPYKKHVAARRCDDPPPELSKAFEMVDISEAEDKAKKIAEHIYNSAGMDILILTRSRTQLSNDVVSELRALGVNVVSSDRLALNECLLVMDILALADICINTEASDYAVACVLKSPYFFDVPMTDDDLYEICYGRITSVLDRLRTFDHDKYAYLSEVISRSKHNDLLGFFYGIVMDVKRPSTRDSEVISAFIDEVMRFMETSPGHLQEFLSYFREREKQIANTDSIRNTVRLSTIHGAKGLEADSVFLLDFNLEADKAKTKIVFTNYGKASERQVRLCIIKPPKRESFEELDAVMEAEYMEERNELVRLLYVAMTRARDSLCIFGEPSGKSAYSMIKEAITYPVL